MRYMPQKQRPLVAPAVLLSQEPWMALLEHSRQPLGPVSTVPERDAWAPVHLGDGTPVQKLKRSSLLMREPS